MPFLTILTPTYNRAYILPALYDSLRQQSCKDFEWLIVDDGSSDNTEDLITTFSADFSIQYIKKQNGGKHTALNVGITAINSDLTFIVDSDDYLLPDAVNLIKQYYSRYASDDSIGALVFLRCHANGTPMIDLDHQEIVTSYIDYRIKGNKPGDMAEVFLTKVLKKYPFPEFIGERFLSEDVVWIELGKSHQFVFINQPIYVCEYLIDGLTANNKSVKFASPLGSMLRGKQLMFPACGIKNNIKGAIIYNCYKKAAPYILPSSLTKHSFYEKFLLMITYPLSLIFFTKWKQQI